MKSCSSNARQPTQSSLRVDTYRIYVRWMVRPVRYSAASPIPRERGSYLTPQITARLDLDPLVAAPHVHFQTNQVTHCRQAIQSTTSPRPNTRMDLREMTWVSSPIQSWSSAKPDGLFRSRDLVRDPRCGATNTTGGMEMLGQLSGRSRAC